MLWYSIKSAGEFETLTKGWAGDRLLSQEDALELWSCLSFEVDEAMGGRPEASARTSTNEEPYVNQYWGPLKKRLEEKSEQLEELGVTRMLKPWNDSASNDETGSR